MITAAVLAVVAGPSALFADLCAPCHGAGGRGDGPAAALYRPPPRDLTIGVFRNGETPVALGRTLREGLPQTGMPSFGALSTGDRDALVADILELRKLGAAAPSEPSSVLWPARPLPPFAPPRPGAPPILGELSARACARCHPKEAEQWGSSRHALAAGEGLWRQTPDPATPRAGACRHCHAPLAEQAGDAGLRGEGVTCAACHRRDDTKLSTRAPSGLRPTGFPVRVVPAFGRATQCLPCHNLPLDTAVEGKPLLDTWREWAASPYLVAGLSCQVCHFGEGDHRLRGAHDADAVRQAVRLELDIAPTGGRAVVAVTNVGAGHAFPTTATPRVVLRIRQLDDTGRMLPGTEVLWAIGRTVDSNDGGRTWRQRADTRILPGATRRWPYENAPGAGAATLEAELFMYPDWFYARVFRERASTDPEFAGLAAPTATSGFRITGVRRPWPRGP